MSTGTDTDYHADSDTDNKDRQQNALKSDGCMSRCVPVDTDHPVQKLSRHSMVSLDAQLILLGGKLKYFDAFLLASYWHAKNVLSDCCRIRFGALRRIKSHANELRILA